jgi:hypothetical protein
MADQNWTFYNNFESLQYFPNLFLHLFSVNNTHILRRKKNFLKKSKIAAEIPKNAKSCHLGFFQESFFHKICVLLTLTTRKKQNGKILQTFKVMIKSPNLIFHLG